MPIPLYLAMTASEFHANSAFPEHLAWMSCLFSPYGRGLSNLPGALPADSLLILSDRTPICGHDPELIADQLTDLVVSFRPCGLLLDFERSGSQETAHLVQVLTSVLPCPVCVSALYARERDCPVFLPPPPLDMPLEKYLAPCSGREIWLEAAVQCQCYTLRPSGCSVAHSVKYGDYPFREEALHCRYRIEITDGRVDFNLCRTGEDLASMLEESAALGVTKAVGLWQELK